MEHVTVGRLFLRFVYHYLLHLRVYPTQAYLVYVYLIFTYKMRSAQAPCGAWAIMKKFIYECNDKHYIFACLV